MYAYYFQLGLRSLRRNPMLTALMIMAIGFGVAASMTTYSVFRATASNPIPDKSDKLFIPQIDNWGPDNTTSGEPPPALTYKDAIALWRAHKAPRQSIIYPVATAVVPADPSRLPMQQGSYAVTSDFFPMFDVPFIYGRGWSAEEDDKREAVTVISRALNDKLFNGEDSTGKQIDIDDHLYRISGVIDDWNPTPRYFDLPNTGGFDDAPSVFVPFFRMTDLQKLTAGNNNCVSDPGDGWDNYIRSECIWIGMWVELPNAADVTTFRRYLDGYTDQQRSSGRFRWATNTRLRDVMQWLDAQHVVPPETQISLLVSLGFLAICLVNTIGLLLAKFLRRAPEIGVRRALGASRREIYIQFLMEAATVGLAGGVLGLVLTGLGVMGVGLIFEPQIAELAHVDFKLVLLTMLVAIGATVLAAFYPTWRAAQVQPAWQLKSN
jgi:putative ABC transport system permease protein